MTTTLLVLLTVLIVLGAVWALLFGAWELWRGWREAADDAHVSEAWHRHQRGKR
jgi:ABC-type nickel/cobalt efflux system permease component RcnA